MNDSLPSLHSGKKHKGGLIRKKSARLSRSGRCNKLHLFCLTVEIQAEEARTRGTAVTADSFRAWKINFDREIAAKRSREEEDKLKGLTAKEREEWRKVGTRLSGKSFLLPQTRYIAYCEVGRQLFERNKNLEEDSLLEEGTVSVDASQYERTREDDDEQDEVVSFSDSD